MSDLDLDRFVRLIHEESGISVGENQRSMLSARLLKRMRRLGINSFAKYYSFLCSPDGRAQELVAMIDAVTTNKTSFFREDHHFEYLTQHFLPEIIRTQLMLGHRPLNVWSAGCSTGEEPYTIAMVLASYFRNNYSSFTILATDLSTQVLRHAKRAVYLEHEIEGIPPQYRTRYLMSGKGGRAGQYRIVPEVRQCIGFRRLNLINDEFTFPEKFDIVFCRNVMIYFDVPSIMRLARRFHGVMTSNGVLFIGHSESLLGFRNDFNCVAPTVYRKVR